MNPSSLAVLPEHDEMPWTESRSMSPDDDMHDLPHSPLSDSRHWLHSDSDAHMQTGQLSPDSTGMHASATLHHPSRTDSWATSSTQRSLDADDDQDALWEQSSGDALIIPKLEPTEDDFDLDEVMEAPPPSSTTDQPPTTSATQTKEKRPRGRPRKHPLNTIINTSKVTKGRSKTGCITCRKRKKKCDEAKPRCLNCEKNAVVCEGYHEKKIWRSGKDKAGEDRPAKEEDTVVFNMQPLFHGVVTAEDKIFWKHYYVSLSNVLTVEGEANNAFKDILLPIANRHQGVMHSILAMSSKHIDYNTPYGAKILQQNPNTTRELLQKRADHHHEEAMQSFYADIRRSGEEEHTSQHTITSARYAQILCLLIGTLIDGNRHGEHRVHLRGYQHLIQQAPPEDPAFLAFITEFFQYHIFADELMWYPGAKGIRLSSDSWTHTPTIETPRLLGVADGLFQHLSQIATIRDTVRKNIYSGAETRVNYHLLWQAQEIQEAIELWAPAWPVGDSRHRVGLIYKHMMFLHLFRTTYPPTMPSLKHGFDNAPVSPVSLRRPSQVSRPTTASSSSSSPGLNMASSSNALPTFQQRSPPGSRIPSRTNSMHESDPVDKSPLSAQGRRPPHHDARITAAVEESLALMESFKSSDPALTLLLMPCQVIGVACFGRAQQERIRAVVRRIRGYTGLRNCDRVSEVLEEIWRLMDDGDWLSVWDWQAVARKMDADFLCT
ncbi:fungal-specific transcription factor domain-containing protein [Plectosphaerella plurivora]|uniref:Fungal-specific transcription factor domain-containing protein n=1 Tax=Plectosphaerella plurivora TaxID=936078 RepID=A0A9P8V2Y0_9PEZI|nr:fungal-specific transcription factor domain-containing protein [Plectosphaerella plurivora]